MHGRPTRPEFAKLKLDRVTYSNELVLVHDGSGARARAPAGDASDRRQAGRCRRCFLCRAEHDGSSRRTMMKALVLAGLSAVRPYSPLAAAAEKAPAPALQRPRTNSRCRPPRAAGPPRLSPDSQLGGGARRPRQASRRRRVPQSAGSDPLTVPMLLPGGIVQTASDRPMPPRITKDGYFATYHLPRYDVIVNGSQQGLCRPARTRRRRQVRDEIPRRWRPAPRCPSRAMARTI